MHLFKNAIHLCNLNKLLMIVLSKVPYNIDLVHCSCDEMQTEMVKAFSRLFRNLCVPSCQMTWQFGRAWNTQ